MYLLDKTKMVIVTSTICEGKCRFQEDREVKSKNKSSFLHTGFWHSISKNCNVFICFIQFSSLSGKSVLSGEGFELIF